MTHTSADRIPTPRDARIREGMAALLTHGSERKASAACGIPRITLKRWSESDEGRAILAELRGAGQTGEAGEQFAAKFAALKVTLLETATELAAQFLEAVREKKIPPREIPIPLGIIVDKLTRMSSGGEDQGGEVVVQVFGGTLATSTAPAQGVAVQVTTKGGRNG